MTISTTANRKEYSGNGVTTNFSFPYYFFADADLKVYLVDADNVSTLQVLSTDYTVNDAGVLSGGSIDMVTAPASGETLIIIRDISATQEVDYITAEAFPAETHERALDRLTMLVQQTLDKISRTFRLADSDVSADTEIAEKGVRANKILTFDVDGNVLLTQELGTWQGDWVTATVYSVRDTFRDPTTGNLYFVTTSHTSTTISADVASGYIDVIQVVDPDGNYYTKSALDTGALDTRYYTKSALDTGALDTRYYTETEVDNALNLKANLISPALIGVPTAPTANPGTASTQLATTEFVKAKSEGDSIGVGQTWQDVTASRTAGVTYTNSTGKPIIVAISSNQPMTFYVDGVSVWKTGGYSTAAPNSTLLVPPDSTYQVDGAIVGSGQDTWFELR